MSTFRVNKNVNYTVMSNHHLQDKRLSLKAKGLLSYMLSLPDDWDYSLKGLTVGCKDGLDSVRTAVLELEEHGYVRRQKVRNAKGQIIDYDYQVYESPVEDAPAVPGKEGGPSNPSASKSPKSRMKPCSSPFLDFPNLAEPNLEKATQQNTNKQNIFVLHPRFPHLFGRSFGISVSDRKQQACAAAVQICGAFCFPYTAGGLHIAEKLPFPRCRMDGIFIYSVIERFH